MNQIVKEWKIDYHKRHMIKIILKFAFAGGIVYWLIDSGKLDFSLVTRSLTEGPYAYIAFGILMAQALLSSFRWRMLLQSKTKDSLPALQLIKLTWIGLFFSSVLPGAVTGDLLKLVYAKDLSPKLTKTFLVMSALMDRVIGLMGLLFLLGMFSILNYNEVVQVNPIMSHLVHVNFLLFLGVIVFFVTLFLPAKIQHTVLHLTHKVPVLGNKIANTIEQVWLMGKDKRMIINCLLLSILLQFMGVLAFWTITHAHYGKDLSLSMVFTFVPLGMMAIAVPISPAGLGVGHAIFDKLFSFFGIHQGASLFNLFFISMVINNLLGIIPYLTAGKRKSLEEIESFEKAEHELMDKETEQI